MRSRAARAHRAYRGSSPAPRSPRSSDPLHRGPDRPRRSLAHARLLLPARRPWAPGAPRVSGGPSPAPRIAVSRRRRLRRGPGSGPLHGTSRTLLLSLEEYDGLSVVTYAVLLPAALDELPELGVAGAGVSFHHSIQRVTYAQDPFPNTEPGYPGRQYGT